MHKYKAKRMPSILKPITYIFRQTRMGLRNSINRRSHPERYWLQDKTERIELLREGLFSVHYYPPLPENRVDIEGEILPVNKKHFSIPLILVPPLGVYAWIFDLMAERSLVRYFLVRGFQVYLIDWGKPGRGEAELSLETYTLNWFPKAVKAIQAHSGQTEVSVLGYCMGGLLSLMYTAARGTDVVRNLITIASPVNLHQMGNGIGKLSLLISGPTGLIRRVTGSQLSKLDPNLFHVDGKILSVLFKASSPAATVLSYIDLIKNLADDDYVSRYMTMNEWFSNMPDYPGATVLELIQKLGIANRMNRGHFNLGGHEVSFSRIKSALLAFAGDRDAITSISSASAVMNVVGSLDKTFQVVSGGHAGIFTGSRAAHSTWVIAADWLELRSDLAEVEPI
ncbi:alpha/beta fold hydrolase [Aquirhabdus parva]|uniref:Alpha/beta fold hydrolase n=2 Tax=Aquirhabdus parva TaxID=2283318 RepID=A0A345P5J4_9GAMM|nr:alpha/beta fold hydrolase [Aquirhabdus parva]